MVVRHDEKEKERKLRSVMHDLQMHKAGRAAVLPIL